MFQYSRTRKLVFAITVIIFINAGFLFFTTPVQAQTPVTATVATVIKDFPSSIQQIKTEIKET